MNNLYRFMYKLVNEEKDFEDKDEILEMAIDNLKNNMHPVIQGEVKEISRSLKEIDYDNVIGTIVLSGVNEKQSEESCNKIIEKRVIGKKIYYLFIILNIRNEEELTALDINDISRATKIDAYSRLIDYYLDIFNKNNQTMRYLNIRDTNIEDPLVILSKAALLINSDIGKEIFNEVYKDDTGEFFHLIDKYITPNLRTDWLISKNIKLTDKANAFSLQILLKQEIYDFCINIRNDDIQKEKSNYIDLFVNGEIYKLDGYPHIQLFVAHGSTTFSTKELNKYWNSLT